MILTNKILIPLTCPINFYEDRHNVDTLNCFIQEWCNGDDIKLQIRSDEITSLKLRIIDDREVFVSEHNFDAFKTLNGFRYANITYRVNLTLWKKYYFQLVDNNGVILAKSTLNQITKGYNTSYLQYSDNKNKLETIFISESQTKTTYYTKDSQPLIFKDSANNGMLYSQNTNSGYCLFKFNTNLIDMITHLVFVNENEDEYKVQVQFLDTMSYGVQLYECYYGEYDIAGGLSLSQNDKVSIYLETPYATYEMEDMYMDLTGKYNLNYDPDLTAPDGILVEKWENGILATPNSLILTHGFVGARDGNLYSNIFVAENKDNFDSITLLKAQLFDEYDNLIETKIGEDTGLAFESTLMFSTIDIYENVKYKVKMFYNDLEVGETPLFNVSLTDNECWLSNTTDFYFNIRFVGGFMANSDEPKADNTDYQDQENDNVSLHQNPYREYELLIGDNRGVSYSFRNMLNNVFQCEELRINYIDMVKANGQATFEAENIDRTGNKTLKIKLQEKENDYLQNILLGLANYEQLITNGENILIN